MFGSLPLPTVILLFLLFLLFPYARAQSSEILMFGDSLTQGLQRDSNYQIYGTTSPPNGERVNGSYGPKLETNLASRETTFCYNWGLMGEQTSAGVNRIGKVLASRHANFILIQEGANDLINGISPATTKFNLGIMIDKSRQANVIPVLGETMPLSCPVACGFDPLVNHLNSLIINLAIEKGVVLASLLAPLRAGWDTVPFNSGDGVHISDAGYDVIADAWHEAIIKTGRLPYASGSLTVTIEPPAAVSAGVQWSVDNGATWHNSGTQIVLPTGGYSVIFKSLPGYRLPSINNVFIQFSQKSTITSNPNLAGDLNGDSLVDLADVIIALQVVNGVDIPLRGPWYDSNGDQTIGLEEAIHALQHIALYP